MRAWLLCLAWIGAGAQAAPWAFDAPLPVTPEAAPGVYVHLESAGRKSIAVSGGWVAVTWEDNRDGVSRCYVALKAPEAATFGKPVQVSGKEEAAEPVIAGIGGGRFVLAWEEAGHVVARMASAQALGAAHVLGAGAQASLEGDSRGGAYAVWSEKGARFWQIRLARLAVLPQGALRAARAVVVDANAAGDQSYPSVAAASARRVVVAWEDRREGHTVLFDAVSQDGGANFTAPQLLNDTHWGGQNLGYGRGTGVMRVALARRGTGVAAVWADKRDFRSGYDVYGGDAPGPTLRFGPNEKVQDAFGDNIAQWHPAIAANAKGRVAVVWDDDRDGSPDVWLSWREAEGWADNLALPGASGPGVQSDPTIAMDEAGNLHVAWIEKPDLNSPSHIRYVMGRAK